MLGAVLIQKGTAEMIKKKTATGAVAAVPAFDSRTKWPHCVHPIRNQEQCGSCWACKYLIVVKFCDIYFISLCF